MAFMIVWQSGVRLPQASPRNLKDVVPAGMLTPDCTMVSLKLLRSSTYGWLASGLGCPGVGGNPETIESVALPNGALGVERFPPLL